MDVISEGDLMSPASSLPISSSRELGVVEGDVGVVKKRLKRGVQEEVGSLRAAKDRMATALRHKEQECTKVGV